MKTRFKDINLTKNNIKFNKFFILSWMVLIYVFLKHFIPYWDMLVYPINLLVTFLHEFGHSFFALITGWSVSWVQINSNGSWFAITSWWIRSFVLMGWYIWSAIFWNILLYLWSKKSKFSEWILYFLAALMIFVWIFWFNSIFSTIILFLLAWGLYFLAKHTSYDSLILQFLGISSIIYIIEDFNVWPSSDLSKFSTFIPTSVWMIIWLLIVIVITWYNLKLILKK
jgi:hypothetical protein